MTMSYQRADDTLNDALRAPATPFLWLHTGSPGEAGTANVVQLVAADIVRKALVFGDVPANHAVNDERFVLNTAVAEWIGTEITPAQTITHVSIWSAETLGQPEFITAISPSKVVGSDGARIGIGDLEAAIDVFVKPA